jgi:Cu(I)/Ag(I) efflux system membrane protein CusA/SilA
MVGGMVTAPLLSMLVVPAAWYMLHRRRHRLLSSPNATEASRPRIEGARSKLFEA